MPRHVVYRVVSIVGGRVYRAGSDVRDRDAACWSSLVRARARAVDASVQARIPRIVGQLRENIDCLRVMAHPILTIELTLRSVLRVVSCVCVYLRVYVCINMRMRTRARARTGYNGVNIDADIKASAFPGSHQLSLNDMIIAHVDDYCCDRPLPEYSSAPRPHYDR